MRGKRIIKNFLWGIARRISGIFQYLKESWISNKPRWIVVGLITLGSLSPFFILAKIIVPAISVLDEALYLPIILTMILSIYLFLKFGIAILRGFQLTLHPFEKARLTFFSIIVSFSISNAFTFGSLHFPMEENLFFYVQIFARNFVIWWIFLVHLVRVPLETVFRMFAEGALTMVFAIDWYLELWFIYSFPNAVSSILLINLVSLTSWITWLCSVKREANFTRDENCFLFYLPLAGAVLISINDVLFRIMTLPN